MIGGPATGNWSFTHGEKLDLGLILLAVTYVAYVGLSGVGSQLYASADRVTEGEVWLLVTSALEVVTELDTVQWVALALVTAAVIYRLGPRLWWTVSLGGHILAAVLVYAAMEIAVALGSSSAEIDARNADYGISIVLAANLGALTTSALVARKRNGDHMEPADRAALAIGLIGLAAMTAISFGWYDSQHLIGYLIGFILTRFLVDRRTWGIAGGGRFETPR